MKSYQSISCIFNRWAKLVACVVVISIAITACNKDDFSFQEQNRSVQMLDAIRADTSLSIAVQALEKTGIAATLNTYGPFTFFAPDNNAFRAFFKNQGKKGLDDFAKDSLTTIMTYHILPARLKAAEFVSGPQPISTGRGDFISIDISKGYKFNAIANGKAKIYQTDNEYSNGLLHKMDAVLDPPILTIGQFLAQNQNLYSQFSAGLQKAGLTDTVTNLNNAFGTRIRLTLFVESNATLQQAGIDFNNFTPDSVRHYMRNHIVAGAGFSSTYTRLNTAIPTINVIERYDSVLATLDGQDWIYFNLAAPKLINENNSFVSSDIILRNGIIHVVEKPLIFNPDYKRTQLYHRVWAEQAFCYGIPGFAQGAAPVPNNSAGGNFRWYNEGGSPRRENFTFMAPDGVNDSLVVVVRNVKKGSYRITANFKGNNGGRGDFQLMYDTAKIGTPVNFGVAPEYTQNVVIGTYKFATSGNKRLSLVCTRVGGINIECLVLTPTY